MTSNFREGLEKNIEPGVRKSWVPPGFNTLHNENGEEIKTDFPLKNALQKTLRGLMELNRPDGKF